MIFWDRTGARGGGLRAGPVEVTVVANTDLQEHAERIGSLAEKVGALRRFL